MSLLSYIIFLPLLSALIMALFRVPLRILRLGAFVSSLAVLLFSLVLFFEFNPEGHMQFLIRNAWIQSYGIYYNVGIDALSLVILLLTTWLMPAVYLYMWNEERQGYWYNMMILQTSVLGAICSLDLILFYLFWETMLIPIFIMIGRYGHTMNHYNAMKIVLMTILGSLTMLLSILYVGYTYYMVNGMWSFDLADLSTLTFDPQTSIWLAAGFLLAFAIKIPLVGFHTWMAPAYGSSPTPSLIVLSSIMAKLGVYGIWRFGFDMFEAILTYYAPIIMILAIIGLIYYAVHAVTQQNLRKMYAFSSGSHLSLITLGIFILNIYAWGGSLFLIATHALSSAGIFFMIGMLYQRTNSVTIDDLGGIAQVAPKFAFFMAFFCLSIVGVPGTGGFVAELLIIIGAFKYNFIIGVLAATTMIAAMLFVFWMLQRTIFGKVSSSVEGFNDINFREFAILAPLVVMLLLMGIVPSLFMPVFEHELGVMLHNVLANLGGGL